MKYIIKLRDKEYVYSIVKHKINILCSDDIKSDKDLVSLSVYKYKKYIKLLKNNDVNFVVIKVK
jgi:hypothetical protein